MLGHLRGQRRSKLPRPQACLVSHNDVKGVLLTLSFKVSQDTRAACFEAYHVHPTPSNMAELGTDECHKEC